jgi:hypothetical protein
MFKNLKTPMQVAGRSCLVLHGGATNWRPVLHDLHRLVQWTNTDWSPINCPPIAHQMFCSWTCKAAQIRRSLSGGTKLILMMYEMTNKVDLYIYGANYKLLFNGLEQVSHRSPTCHWLLVFIMPTNKRPVTQLSLTSHQPVTSQSPITMQSPTHQRLAIV